MSHGARQASDSTSERIYMPKSTNITLKPASGPRIENRAFHNQGANHSSARTIHITRLRIISGCRLVAFLKMKSTTHCGCLKRDVEKNNSISEK